MSKKRKRAEALARTIERANLSRSLTLKTLTVDFERRTIRMSSGRTITAGTTGGRTWHGWNGIRR